MKDQWDIYEPLGTVPGSSDDLEIIAPPKGACNIGA
jgi:branched-chain amino acid transport system substrate-binding protein